MLFLCKVINTRSPQTCLKEGERTLLDGEHKRLRVWEQRSLSLTWALDRLKLGRGWGDERILVRESIKDCMIGNDERGRVLKRAG